MNELESWRINQSKINLSDVLPRSLDISYRLQLTGVVCKILLYLSTLGLPKVLDGINLVWLGLQVMIKGYMINDTRQIWYR